MMMNIIDNSNGHNVNVKNFPNPDDFVCTRCGTGKLIIRPSQFKRRRMKSPRSWTHPRGHMRFNSAHSGLIWYFMVHIDASVSGPTIA